MAEIRRTTKIILNFDAKSKGGANLGKREYLEKTKEELNKGRKFYTEFFLSHSFKFEERETYIDDKGKEKERYLTNQTLSTWTDSLTWPTRNHPSVLEEWDFSKQFASMPKLYRRSIINDSLGRVKSYLSNLKNWEQSGKKKGKPSLPTANNHPLFYAGTIKLENLNLDIQDHYVQIKVFDGQEWVWVNYPVKFSEWQKERLNDPLWENESPKLIITPKKVELHISQVKQVKANEVKNSKKNPNLITIAVDLNVKNLAVVTVRKHGEIIETEFIKDKGLDQHRYQHMKKVSKKQWQSGKSVKGESSCSHIWKHVKRTNEDFAHKVARQITDIASKYKTEDSECVIVFENLKKIKKGKSPFKSHRLNRKMANQIKGKILNYTREKAIAYGIVTVETNPHGTSQFCSRCGEKGERFSLIEGNREKFKGGKLFYCSHCKYECNADFNASVNVHHSFYKEFHWEWKPKKEKKTKLVQLELTL